MIGTRHETPTFNNEGKILGKIFVGRKQNSWVKDLRRRLGSLEML